MAKPLDSKKPRVDKDATPPETHSQTAPVEEKISPQHNATEPYGKSSEHARRNAGA